MYKLSSMPEQVKFQRAYGMVRLYQEHVLPFVLARLGYDRMYELKSVWQAGMASIREEDPDHEKYENTYNNWLWMARCCHDFLADQLDRQGIADYKRLLLQLYMRQHDNPDVMIFHLVKSHTALARAWAYEMQWMTPIEITSKNNKHVICEVHDCKILQTPATERICRVDCRNVGNALAKKVYHLKRTVSISDHGCTTTLTPIED